MEPARILRQKIDGGHPTAGILLTNHLWMGIIELCVDAAMDYLIIDCEHLHHADELVADTCAVGRLTQFPVLIRPPSANCDAVRMAMDKGPCGLLLPKVDTAVQLDDVKDGIYMPPRGQRRPGGPGNRWVSDVHYNTWKQQVEDPLIILPQIESLTGLENADSLAAHPITTALAIGPYDLSAQLGVCWQPDDPKMADAFATIDQAAARAGKAVWRIGDGPALAQQGYHFICVGTLSSVLIAGMRQTVDQMRQAAKAGPPASS